MTTNLEKQDYLRQTSKQHLALEKAYISFMDSVGSLGSDDELGGHVRIDELDGGHRVSFGSRDYYLSPEPVGISHKARMRVKFYRVLPTEIVGQRRLLDLHTIYIHSDNTIADGPETDPNLAQKAFVTSRTYCAGMVAGWIYDDLMDE